MSKPGEGPPRGSIPGPLRATPDGRPEVIVDFEFRQGMFFLSVRNIGARPAQNVSVEFAPRFTGVGGQKEVTELPLFRELTYLAPDRRIETFLDTSESYFQRRQPTRIKVTVRYSDGGGADYLDRFEHNLEIYRELGYIDRAF